VLSPWWEARELFFYRWSAVFKVELTLLFSKMPSFLRERYKRNPLFIKHLLPSPPWLKGPAPHPENQTEERPPPKTLQRE